MSHTSSRFRIHSLSSRHPPCYGCGLKMPLHTCPSHSAHLAKPMNLRDGSYTGERGNSRSSRRRSITRQKKTITACCQTASIRRGSHLSNAGRYTCTSSRRQVGPSDAAKQWTLFKGSYARGSLNHAHHGSSLRSADVAGTSLCPPRAPISGVLRTFYHWTAFHVNLFRSSFASVALYCKPNEPDPVRCT
ncbi:hypothetical protein BDV98DRAFT_219739 [Pterulicium gracile]|uniref:Uncharacterized protein n=1 Tax=Pterulicium gracile TaxID=1884261 RepID=A0A5C3Q7Q8_9AGAR|nr:hypothetical protein BDV98DRAFT_219739 [Pterula gracilis]